ncbi:MAG: hypothetical protein E6R07_13095 [Nevskiaceae bacterium]|nr:MAG: hypothetical protein E6R07_13095 [Nevskiaceae bacterium]
MNGLLGVLGIIFLIALNWAHDYKDGSAFVEIVFVIVGVYIGWTVVPLSMSGSEQWHTSAFRRFYVRCVSVIATAVIFACFGQIVSGQKIERTNAPQGEFKGN